MPPKSLWDSYLNDQNRQIKAKRYIEENIQLIEEESFDTLFLSCPYILKIPVFKILRESEILFLYMDMYGNNLIRSSNGTTVDNNLIYGI